MKKKNRFGPLVTPILLLIIVLVAINIWTRNSAKLKIGSGDILSLEVSVYDENKNQTVYRYDSSNGYMDIKKDDLDTIAATLGNLEYRAFDIKSGEELIDMDRPCLEILLKKQDQDIQHLYIFKSGFVFQEITEPKEDTGKCLMLKYTGAKDIYNMFIK